MTILLCLLTAPAMANGQTTHLWISQQAVSHVETPELVALLTAESGQLALGTMFPDGGYAIDHAYAETAHWEPFQDEFRQWIRSTFDGVDDPLAAPYISFYMGLASHGMADQVFDSMYMERSRVYDADFGWSDASASLDTSQDIVFANLTYAQAPPDPLLPEILPTLFGNMGVEVDMETLQTGQEWLDVAVLGVAGMSEVSSLVDMHASSFPWGCSHLLDENVPGAPPFEARIVARYWDSLWDDLTDNQRDLEVIGWWPPDGTVGHPQATGDVESRLSLIFNRGLYMDAVTPEYVAVTAANHSVDVSLDLFYRDHSHVVNVSPVDGWIDHEDHQLLVTEMVATDGRTLTSNFTLDFSTRPEEADESSDVDTSGAKSGGCAHLHGLSWAWIVCIPALVFRRNGHHF